MPRHGGTMELVCLVGRLYGHVQAYPVHVGEALLASGQARRPTDQEKERGFGEEIAAAPVAETPESPAVAGSIGPEAEEGEGTKEERPDDAEAGEQADGQDVEPAVEAKAERPDDAEALPPGYEIDHKGGGYYELSGPDGVIEGPSNGRHQGKDGAADAAWADYLDG